MSNYNDLNKIQKQLAKTYKPIMEAANIGRALAAYEAMSKSMGNISSALAAHEVFKESIGDISNALAASETMRKSMGIMAALPSSVVLQELSTSFAYYPKYQSLMASIQPSIEVMKFTHLPIMQEYFATIARFNEAGYKFSDLVKQAYASIEDEEEIEDDFENESEIVEALQEQSDNPAGFQERVFNWSENKKKKYYILCKTLCWLLAIFIMPYLQDTIGKPVVAYVVSKVRELPETASTIIGELQEKNEAIITEDVPYYYKVTFTDEDGNIKEGYVAKKNLQMIDVSGAEEGK